MTEPADQTAPELIEVRPVPPLLSALTSPTADMIFKAVAGLSLILALLVGVKQYTFTNCIADYSNSYNAVAEQRSEAAASTSGAVDKFLDAVFTASNQTSTEARRSAFLRAYNDYIAARAAANEQRKLNPLPTPPKESC